MSEKFFLELRGDGDLLACLLIVSKLRSEISVINTVGMY